jgi:hemolysin activation/secretion protein
MTIHSALSLSARRLGIVLVGLALPLNAAHAQTASQVVRDDYAPPVVRPATGGGLSLPQSNGRQVPDGAERLHVTPSGLLVEGSFPDMQSAASTIESGLKGKRVSGSDLFAAAQALEAAYAQAGYLLVRVSLPPQTLRDGMPLRLVVTDGYVSAVDVSGLPEQARGRIEAVLASLVGQRRLNKGELERRLLLAGDTPGVMLRSTLKPGAAPGSTIIVIDGRYDPVSLTASLDNSLSRELGSYAASLGADFNNLLGLGDVVYLRLAGYPGLGAQDMLSDDPRNRQIVAGVTLPLGADGWWLTLEGVDSRTHPTSNIGYTMLDHYQRLSVKLGHAWIRSRDLNTSSLMSFDVSDEEQDIDIDGARSAFTQDRLRVLRVTQSADTSLANGALLSGDVTLSLGLDALGARHATTDLPVSRDGATPDFAKLEISARYSQSLYSGALQWSLAGQAQTSFGDPLASSEQMGLGGFDWVSAFDSGDLQGDAGAVLRTELGMPFTMPALDAYPAFGSALMPYVFAAGGLAKLENPTALEESVTRAAAFGAGLRFGLSEKASPHSASLSLEYAHGAASGQDQKDRFNLRFLARF